MEQYEREKNGDKSLSTSKSSQPDAETVASGSSRLRHADPQPAPKLRPAKVSAAVNAKPLEGFFAMFNCDSPDGNACFCVHHKHVCRR
jgi:hypothetical protein